MKGKLFNFSKLNNKSQFLYIAQCFLLLLLIFLFSYKNRREMWRRFSSFMKPQTTLSLLKTINEFVKETNDAHWKVSHSIRKKGTEWVKKSISCHRVKLSLTIWHEKTGCDIVQSSLWTPFLFVPVKEWKLRTSK